MAYSVFTSPCGYLSQYKYYARRRLLRALPLGVERVLGQEGVAGALQKVAVEGKGRGLDGELAQTLGQNALGPVHIGAGQQQNDGAGG